MTGMFDETFHLHVSELETAPAYWSELLSGAWTQFMDAATFKYDAFAIRYASALGTRVPKLRGLTQFKTM